jgi:ATP-dependent Lon protease
MLLDALAHDRLIAMALLQPGWEHHYQNVPPIASTVCVGKIVTHTPTSDGRHNILLVGIKRGRIIEELEFTGPFRRAKVEILEDYYPADDESDRRDISAALQTIFAKFVPEGLSSQASFKQLLGEQMPLGILTDMIAYAINLPLALKQQLLAESNVDIRCRLLLRCLKQRLESNQDGADSVADGFPPRFSEN